LGQNWQKIWDGFHAIAEAAPGDREELLDRVCGGDTAIRSEIESLLAVAEQTGDFLDRPVGGGLSAADGPDEDDAPGVGSCIGPYHLVEVLGEGGMGVVYRARQESPLRREVALKLIRAGLDSREVVTRFEGERQALALMDHPNIARVFDAGTTPDHRPYFVMELAPGSHITRYCDERRLGLRDRISLMITVCHAVKHAHRMGIIHRDLKPSNIIVAEIDGQAVPKVIDFGVQKATEPDGAAPAVTRGHHVIGTPEYMSPEQWEAQADIDTRADVYALGVLLYQLLVGALPYEWKDEDGWRPFLRNLSVNDPPTPSARFASLGVGGEEEAVKRHTEAKVLRRRLRGELDWIVMKAIARDRNERYESAGELADELGRFLRHEPVLAGPRSTVYQLRTIARRHRLALVAASAVLISLVIGLLSTTVALLDARRARADAEHQAAVAEGINQFLNHDLLGAVVPDRSGGREVTVREVLDLAAKKIEDGIDGPPVVEGGIRDTLGNSYFALGRYTEAINMLSRALDLRRDALGAEDPATLSSAIALAMSYRKVGRFDEAEALFLENFDLAERVLGPEHPDTMAGLLEFARLYQEQGFLTKAEGLYRRVLVHKQQQHGDEADVEVATVLNNLATVVMDQGRYEEATRLMDESLEIYVRIFGHDHLRTVAVASNLAAVHQGAGNYAEAVPLHRRNLAALESILGSDHDRTLMTRLNLASSLGKIGQYEEAEALAREALEGMRATLGPNHALSLVALRGLAVIIDSRGHSAEAEPLFVEAIVGARQHLPPGHWYTGVFLSQYGRCLTNLGRFEDAEDALLEAYAIIEPVLEPEHSQRKEAVQNLVTLYHRWDRPLDGRLWQERLSTGS